MPPHRVTCNFKHISLTLSLILSLSLSLSHSLSISAMLHSSSPLAQQQLLNIPEIRDRIHAHQQQLRLEHGVPELSDYMNDVPDYTSPDYVPYVNSHMPSRVPVSRARVKDVCSRLFGSGYERSFLSPVPTHDDHPPSPPCYHSYGAKPVGVQTNSACDDARSFTSTPLGLHSATAAVTKDTRTYDPTSPRIIDYSDPSTSDTRRAGQGVRGDADPLVNRIYSPLGVHYNPISNDLMRRYPPIHSNPFAAPVDSDRSNNSEDYEVESIVNSMSPASNASSTRPNFRMGAPFLSRVTAASMAADYDIAMDIDDDGVTHNHADDGDIDESSNDEIRCGGVDGEKKKKKMKKKRSGSPRNRDERLDIWSKEGSAFSSFSRV